MENELRIKALAEYLEIAAAEIEISKYDEQILETGTGKYPGEYLVVDDDEADVIWDERLNSYLEECVLPELPDHLRFYFDEESWRNDAEMDGRSHAISSYDGCEHEIEIDGEWVYIFRLN